MREKRIINTSPILKQLIEPISIQDFEYNYLGKLPLPSHNSIFQNERNYYQKNIKKILNSKSLPWSSVTVIKSGLPVQKFHGVKKTKDLHSLIVNRGYSLLVREWHRVDSRFVPIVNQLQKTFNSIVSINAYLTPSKQKTFNRHWDDHDVIMVQILGSKDWSISSPLIHKPMFNSTCRIKTDQIMKILLKPGSSLYLPRGYVHEGLASSEEPISFHITIGIYNTFRFEFLQQLLCKVLQQAQQDSYFRDDLLMQEISSSKKKKNFLNNIFSRISNYIDVDDMESCLKEASLQKFTAHKNTGLTR